MSELKDKLQTKSNGEVSNEVKKPQSIEQWIKVMQPAIEKALPKVITPERFSRMALTAIRITPQLADCSPVSFMGALMQAAQLGLEPNTPLGQAYLIPFKNNKRREIECQFQIGYKGLIDLAHRSGEFKSIYARTVYENDDFDFEYGLDQQLKHIPAKENRGKAIYFYGVYQLVNGGFGFEVMSVRDIEETAKKYSQSFSSSYSPWQKNFEEMAKKTVLKRVLKYAPIKVEFAKEMAADASIKNEINEDMLDTPSENIFEAEYTVQDDNEDTTETN